MELYPEPAHHPRRSRCQNEAIKQIRFIVTMTLYHVCIISNFFFVMSPLTWCVFFALFFNSFNCLLVIVVWPALLCTSSFVCVDSNIFLYETKIDLGFKRKSIAVDPVRRKKCTRSSFYIANRGSFDVTGSGWNKISVRWGGGEEDALSSKDKVMCGSKIFIAHDMTARWRVVVTWLFSSRLYFVLTRADESTSIFYSIFYFVTFIWQQ